MNLSEFKQAWKGAEFLGDKVTLLTQLQEAGQLTAQDLKLLCHAGFEAASRAIWKPLTAKPSKVSDLNDWVQGFAEFGSDQYLRVLYCIVRFAAGYCQSWLPSEVTELLRDVASAQIAREPLLLRAEEQRIPVSEKRKAISRELVMNDEQRNALCFSLVAVEQLLRFSAAEDADSRAEPTRKCVEHASASLANKLNSEVKGGSYSPSQASEMAVRWLWKDTGWQILVWKCAGHDPLYYARDTEGSAIWARF